MALTFSWAAGWCEFVGGVCGAGIQVDMAPKPWDALGLATSLGVQADEAPVCAGGPHSSLRLHLGGQQVCGGLLLGVQADEAPLCSTQRNPWLCSGYQW